MVSDSVARDLEAAGYYSFLCTITISAIIVEKSVKLSDLLGGHIVENTAV